MPILVAGWNPRAPVGATCCVQEASGTSSFHIFPMLLFLSNFEWHFNGFWDGFGDVFSCVFIADGVYFQSMKFQSFPSIYESHSGSEKFRRYAFYTVKRMVSTHSAIFGNVDLPLYFKNIDIDLRKFSAMDFHDFYVVFEVRILMVSWVWF